MIDKFNYLFGKNPVLLQYTITERCNSRCRQCDYWKRKPENRELGLGEIDRIFSDLHGFGIRYVQISGGEPTLRKDIVEVCNLLVGKGLNVHLSSNALLLKEELCDRLSKTGVKMFISLDSLKRERYRDLRGVDALELVLENIKRVRKKFGLVRLNMVVSSVNSDEVWDMLDFCVKNDYYISFYPYNEQLGLFGANDEELEKGQEKLASLFREIARRVKTERHIFGTRLLYQKAAEWIEGKPIGRCAAGKDLLVLNYDGRLHSCFKFREMGNLREKQIREIYAPNWEAIEKCNQNTPCFLGCTRGMAIVRENVLSIIIEALLDGKVFDYARSV